MKEKKRIKRLVYIGPDVEVMSGIIRSGDVVYENENVTYTNDLMLKEFGNDEGLPERSFNDGKFSRTKLDKILE